MRLRHRRRLIPPTPSPTSTNDTPTISGALDAASADAPYRFIQWLFDSVTNENNENGEVQPVQIRDFMGSEIEANFRRLEWWTDRATLHPRLESPTRPCRRRPAQQ